MPKPESYGVKAISIVKFDFLMVFHKASAIYLKCQHRVFTQLQRMAMCTLKSMTVYTGSFALCGVKNKWRLNTVSTVLTVMMTLYSYYGLAPHKSLLDAEAEKRRYLRISPQMKMGRVFIRTALFVVLMVGQ